MKRNQQVNVFVADKGNIQLKAGRVSAIGRDVVMLNNLTNRIWIPYHAIDSANIPAGVPTYSNSHQYFIYDNNLKNKLIKDFGGTVSKRDALIQQFFEETLETNLRSWKGIWVKVSTDEENYIGAINQTSPKHLVLAPGETKIRWEDIRSIYSLRFFQKWYLGGRKILKWVFSIL
jgi:hypothetical protein